MTDIQRNTQTQRRIDEIEKQLEQLRPRCDTHLAGCPRPGSGQMCRMEQLESELKMLKDLQRFQLG